MLLYTQSALRRIRSDCAGAHADLGLLGRTSNLLGNVVPRVICKNFKKDNTWISTLISVS